MCTRCSRICIHYGTPPALNYLLGTLNYRLAKRVYLRLEVLLRRRRHIEFKPANHKDQK